MPSRYGRYGAALGGLILALAVVGLCDAGAGQQAGDKHQTSDKRWQADPVAAHYKPNCASPENNTDAQYCEQQRASVAAEEQAKWAAGQFWVGIAGVSGVVVTLLYTIRAANAAKAAAEVIPVLERAYLYPLIVEDRVHSALVATRAMHQHGKPDVLYPAPDAEVSFRNFGKTPAVLIYGEVTMTLIGRGPRVGRIDDLPIKYDYVLAERDATDPFLVTLGGGWSKEDCDAVLNATASIAVTGFLTYRDIWGTERDCPVSFTYNPALKRLDANVRPQQKGQHDGLLSRFLVSHWLDGISA